ncbi:hypothetical protein EC957_000903 [Mortierella hygrophila]|uniref:Uncharacterized protein n=1 Tax=Mortierella hygrophila TaxID=979708 RepID=A0A9P6F6W3_9FUNG|nr:hypothetical protein EC957_000903 [Mortierella hygrophila]
MVYPHDVFNNAPGSTAAGPPLDRGSSSRGRLYGDFQHKARSSSRRAGVQETQVQGKRHRDSRRWGAGTFFETGSAFAGQISRAYERMTVEERELMIDNAKYLKYFTESSRKKPVIPPYIEVGAESPSRGAFRVCLDTDTFYLNSRRHLCKGSSLRNVDVIEEP